MECFRKWSVGSQIACEFIVCPLLFVRIPCVYSMNVRLFSIRPAVLCGSPLSRLIRRCMAQKNKDDLHRVAVHLVKNRKMSAQQAEAEASGPSCATAVRTSVPENCGELLKEAQRRFKKASDDSEKRERGPSSSEYFICCALTKMRFVFASKVLYAGLLSWHKKK